FRLRWDHDGIEGITECLEFGAEAATVQDALEAIGYDLDGSGTSFEEGDHGHVLVTRDGDASASSGYGYVYLFEFKGVAGVSTVVGNVEQIQVVGIGAVNGCTDVGGIIDTDTLDGITGNTTDGSYHVTPSASIAG
ncbi:unnamed protein product, partial [Ectocarpus sp. 12 AP-2014]